MREILYKLFDYHYLTRDESKQLLDDIVKGDIPEAQIASIITSFLMRSISIDEILGFRDALLEIAVAVDLSEYSPLDIVGTGGDGKNSFNISTAACFVVAGAGYRVVKHGNWGSTSISGASNVIEQQGVKFSREIDLLRKSLDTSNMAYLHAPLFSPALKAVAPIRKTLGVRSFFNLLGPLINPVQPDYQLLGVYSPAMLRLYNYIYQQESKKFSIVHTIDGYDEISLTTQFKVVSNRGEQLFMPDELGFAPIDHRELDGGSRPEEAAEIFRRVFSLTASEAQVNVVLVNAAFGIATVDQERSIKECLEIAKESLYSKKALRSLKKFVEINS